MKYIISEEELIDFVITTIADINLFDSGIMPEYKIIENNARDFLESRQPVEEIAEGEICNIGFDDFNNFLLRLKTKYKIAGVRYSQDNEEFMNIKICNEIYTKEYKGKSIKIFIQEATK